MQTKHHFNEEPKHNHAHTAPRTVLVMDLRKEKYNMGHISHLAWAEGEKLVGWFIIFRPDATKPWRLVNTRSNKCSRQTETQVYNGPDCSEQEMIDGFKQMCEAMKSQDRSITEYKLFPVQSSDPEVIRKKLEEIAMTQDNVDFVFNGSLGIGDGK